MSKISVNNIAVNQAYADTYKNYNQCYNLLQRQKNTK